jgi:hypothetical protein
MRRMLSKGVRVYVHYLDETKRWNYNSEMGIPVVASMRKSGILKQIAVGSEEGAMVVHYKAVRAL